MQENKDFKSKLDFCENRQIFKVFAVAIYSNRHWDALYLRKGVQKFIILIDIERRLIIEIVNSYTNTVYAIGIAVQVYVYGIAIGIGLVCKSCTEKSIKIWCD